MRINRSILIVTLSFFLTPTAFASGTGTIIAGSGTDIWSVRMERIQGFATATKNFALVKDAWPEKWQKNRMKISAHIAKCRDAVRKANRDTVLGVSMQCLKTQLLMEQDFLKRERTIVQETPGVTAPIREAALQKNDALYGAMQTLIDGIDAKVFHTVDNLKNVRKNLLTQYRIPYWLTLAQLQADEALTWMASLLLQARDIHSSLITCLEAAETSFTKASIATTEAEAHTAFSMGRDQIAKCTLPVTGSGSALSGSSSGF